MLIPKSPKRATILSGVSAAFLLLVLWPAVMTLSCRSHDESAKTVAPTPTPQPLVMMGPPGYPAPVLGKPYPGTGIVTTVNLKEGWVSLEHEDIKDLMPAMAMEFWVRDPLILKGVQVGDKVDFVVVEDSKGQYLTEIKKVAPPR